jgi:hypothetical protein
LERGNVVHPLVHESPTFIGGYRYGRHAGIADFDIERPIDYLRGFGYNIGVERAPDDDVRLGRHGGQEIDMLNGIDVEATGGRPNVVVHIFWINENSHRGLEKKLIEREMRFARTGRGEQEMISARYHCL